MLTGLVCLFPSLDWGSVQLLFLHTGCSLFSFSGNPVMQMFEFLFSTFLEAKNIKSRLSRNPYCSLTLCAVNVILERVALSLLSYLPRKHLALTEWVGVGIRSCFSRSAY